MAAEFMAAMAGAAGAIFGGIITAWANERRFRLDRQKLSLDARRLDAEIAKLSAETEKIGEETSNLHRAKHEMELLVLEQDKKQISAIMDVQNNTYPQFLELTYRIRNQLRSIKSGLETFLNAITGETQSNGLVDFIEACRGDGSTNLYIVGLHQLGEDLYRYRVFIDNANWQRLHEFKRISQDLAVTLDRVLRMEDRRHPPFVNEGELRKFFPILRQGFSRIDFLYLELVKSIKKHFDEVFDRFGVNEYLKHQILGPIFESDAADLMSPSGLRNARVSEQAKQPAASPTSRLLHLY